MPMPVPVLDADAGAGGGCGDAERSPSIMGRRHDGSARASIDRSIDPANTVAAPLEYITAWLGRPACGSRRPPQSQSIRQFDPCPPLGTGVGVFDREEQQQTHLRTPDAGAEGERVQLPIQNRDLRVDLSTPYRDDGDAQHAGLCIDHLA